MDKVRTCILWDIPRRDAASNMVRHCEFLGEDRLCFRSSSMCELKLADIEPSEVIPPDSSSLQLR
jgi:hypothetical protein